MEEGSGGGIDGTALATRWRFELAQRPRVASVHCPFPSWAMRSQTSCVSRVGCTEAPPSAAASSRLRSTRRNSKYSYWLIARAVRKAACNESFHGNMHFHQPFGCSGNRRRRNHLPPKLLLTREKNW